MGEKTKKKKQNTGGMSTKNTPLPRKGRVGTPRELPRKKRRVKVRKNYGVKSAKNSATKGAFGK